MSLTIRRLRSFIAVAEHLSYRRAAEELATSQPALTSHIKEIESYLDVSLFHRTTRQVTLTAEGAAFLVRAKRVLEELDSAVSNVKERAASQRGRVIVACTPTIAGSLLPVALTEMRAQHPGIEVQIYDDRPEIVYRKIETGEVDFAVGPPPHTASELQFQRLTSDSFVAICPTHHSLARAREISLKELASHALITMREGLSMRHELDRIFTEHGYILNPVFEVHHHHTVLGLVAADLGLGVLPKLLFPAQPRNLKAIQIVKPTITRAIGILSRRGVKLTPASVQLIRMFRVAARQSTGSLF